MNDMTSVIIPKSDQYNAEDFLAGPRTFCIEAISINPGNEQPVAIKLQGESRVWRPCKSMSRCLVSAWGANASAYIGRSVTLYCDPSVKWGGLAVGGIRISHLTHIEREMVMALTETKGKRKPFTVKPLVIQKPVEPKPTAPKQTPMQWFTGRIASLENREQCAALFAEGTKARALLDQQSEEDRGAVYDMLSEKRATFLTGPTPPDDDTFPGDLPSEVSA